jgi:hypothetical protein
VCEECGTTEARELVQFEASAVPASTDPVRVCAGCIRNGLEMLDLAGEYPLDASMCAIHGVTVRRTTPTGLNVCSACFPTGDLDVYDT